MLYLLFASLLMSLCIAEDSDCPRECSCPNERRADCTHVGIDPMSLNLNVKYVDLFLSDNSVGAVRKEMYARRVDMQFLVLKYNKITEIEGGILDNNQKLIELDLSYNMLKSLPQNLFRNNSRLERFYCEYNSLSEISENLFQGLTNLKDVRLSNNNLLKIPPSTFAKNRLLSILYIHNNRLETAHR